MRIALSLLVLSGCLSGASTFTDADRQEIETFRAAFLDALMSGDVAGAVSMYAEDTFVMPANAPAVSGKIGLLDMFRNAPPVGSARFYGDRFIPAGDMVMVVGNYAMTVLPHGSDVVVADTGKYMEVWRREDGRWRIAWNIWNSNRPIPEPPAPPPPPDPGRRR